MYTFHPFSRLPLEIRDEIWKGCLPPCPSVHFFNVNWSDDEFHISASKKQKSGYLTILVLLGTCREARAVVAAHYRKVVPRRIVDSFDNPDWIPPSDLVLLCLRSKLLNAHRLWSRGDRNPPGWRFNGKSIDASPFAATLANGAHVGVVVSQEMLLCDDSQRENLQAVPMFLKEFCRGEEGLRRIYILTGLRAWLPFPRTPEKKNGNWPGHWPENPIAWAMNRAELFRETLMPWNDNAVQRRQGTGAYRQFWWVGSGSAALALALRGEMVPRNLFSAMRMFENQVERGCQEFWGKNFGNAELLGWIGAEMECEGYCGDKFEGAEALGWNPRAKRLNKSS